MHARRPRLKRIAVWTAAVVLLLAGYIGGAPVVAFFAQRYLPQSESFFQVVYAPLLYVAQNPEAPGHAEFTAYLMWAFESLERAFPL
jgi:hypothetical protein